VARACKRASANGTQLAGVPAPVVLADDDGVLVLVNRRLEHLFGYQRGELVGRPRAKLHVCARAGGRS
jgi:PAS domain S-box-containing protein